MRFSRRAYNPLVFIGLTRPPDPIPSQADIEANAHHLVWEITWYGIMVGMATNFMQVYVVRLGAPALIVGAVTYGPALISVLWQMVFARLINRSGRRMRWMLVSGLGQRTMVLLIALLPFVVKTRRPEITVLLLVLQAFPLCIGSISFLSVMAAAVPTDRLSSVVSARMVGYGVTTTLSTFLAGRLLNWLPLPLNYQVLFLIGFTASVVSHWHCTRLCVPDLSPVTAPAASWWREPGRTLRIPRFARFVIVVGVLQMALGMVAPLLPLFWVRRLGATDEQISIIVTAYSATIVLGSLLMRKVVGWVGRERTLALGALGYALYPLLTSFSSTIGWLVGWAALGGLFYAAISVTLVDNLVGASPEKERTTFIAVYNVFVNAALFFGPLLAGLLSRTAAGAGLGLRIAAGFALAAGLLFIRWQHAPGSESQIDYPAAAARLEPRAAGKESLTTTGE